VLLHLYATETIAGDRRRAAEQAADQARLAALAREPRKERATEPGVILRVCRAGDAADLARLAQLEGAVLPRGSFVVAEQAGAIVAAVPLDGRARPLGDPFRPTAHVIELLELRAAQIRGAGSRRRTRLRLLARTA
jgi:hypothetical protein